VHPIGAKESRALRRLQRETKTPSRHVFVRNDGQDTRAIQHYLGHRSIASTVRYTTLAPDRCKHFWKD
jgi:site-specific recombinase XerD